MQEGVGGGGGLKRRGWEQPVAFDEREIANLREVVKEEVIKLQTQET